ncbi:hypothetical protein R84B8_01121 [Treponema sp. R8-4-B8]
MLGETLEGGKLCQQIKMLMKCSLGVFLSVLLVGPIAAVAGFSVAAHARRAYAAAHVHVHAYQAAARQPLELAVLKIH